MIVNRKGSYNVGGTLHKVTSDGIFTDTQNNTDLIATIHTPKQSKKIKSIGFVRCHQDFMLKSGNCGDYSNETSETNGTKYCYASISVERVYCLEACCTHNWYYVIHAYSEAKRTYLDALYKSAHKTYGIEVVMNVPSNADYSTLPTTFTMAEEVYSKSESAWSSDVKRYYYWQNKPAGQVVKAYNPYEAPPAMLYWPVMTKVKGSFVTRGSHPKKAVIDCGYGY